jgi:glutamyl-tRNA reductase
MSSVSTSEIIARNMAALKERLEAAAAREMLMAVREEAKKVAREEAKKAWQLSELARIERGAASPEAMGLGGGLGSGYGGYLDGYRG